MGGGERERERDRQCRTEQINGPAEFPVSPSLGQPPFSFESRAEYQESVRDAGSTATYVRKIPLGIPRASPRSRPRLLKRPADPRKMYPSPPLSLSLSLSPASLDPRS